MDCFVGLLDLVLYIMNILFKVDHGILQNSKNKRPIIVRNCSKTHVVLTSAAGVSVKENSLKH